MKPPINTRSAFLNIEIKAKCNNPQTVRKFLKSKKADFKGSDHQIDTYFNATTGRLKLREGEIENHLIYYERTNQPGPKQSKIMLYKTAPSSTLKDILTKSLGVLAAVDKIREIYFIDNVKFHIDDVKGLGSFVEIEAIDYSGDLGLEKISEQCNLYLKALNILPSDLLAKSYSDLVLTGSETTNK